MRSSFIAIALSALLISLALAAPSADPYAWSPALADYYSKVSKHIEEARQAPSFPSPPACDLSKASPPPAPTPLPSPDGLNLALVAVGRGVQVGLLIPRSYFILTNHRTTHAPLPTAHQNPQQ